MVKLINYLLLALLSSCILSCSEQPKGQVKVEGGMIQGTVTENLTIYKGIPFAAPPARHGNPNGEGVPEWPALSDANPKIIYFQQTPQIGPVPSAESLEVLDDYFRWRRSPEGEAWAR